MRHNSDDMEWHKIKKAIWKGRKAVWVLYFTLISSRVYKLAYTYMCSPRSSDVHVSVN